MQLRSALLCCAMVMPLGTLGQNCDPACIAGQICSCGGTRRSRRRTQLEKKAEKAPSVAEHAARLKEHGHAAKQRPTFDLADQESFRPSPVKHLEANQSFLIGRRLFGVPPTTCAHVTRCHHRHRRRQHRHRLLPCHAPTSHSTRSTPRAPTRLPVV